MKNRFVVICFIFIQIFFNSSNLFSQISKEKKIELTGYLSDMQSIMMSDINQEWINTNIFHNRLSFNYNFNSKFSFTSSLRTRLIYGDQIKYDINKFYIKSLDFDNSFFDLSYNLADGNSYVLNSTIDRISFNYQNSKYAFNLGRQRINWGQTFVWNPNDLFNNYSYFDFDYTERPGSDAIRVQYFLNSSSRIDFATKVNHNDTITGAILYGFNKFNTDFQFIVAYYNQTDYVAGLGITTNLLNGLLRTESSYFIPTINSKDSTNVFLSSIGYDYMFENQFFFQVEFLFNSNGTQNLNFDINNFISNNLSTKNISLFKYNYFVSLSYPLSPLIKSSLSGMYFPSSKLVFIIPSLDFSLKDNLDLSLISQLYFAKTLIHSIAGGIFFIRLKGSF